MSHKGRWRGCKTFLRRHSVISGILYLIVAFLLAAWPVCLEIVDDLTELASTTLKCNAQQREAPASFQFGSLYQEVFQHLHAQPHTDEVKVIFFSESVPKILGNVCAGRLLTADVLDTLQGLQPSAVALDKFYSPVSCQDPATETAALQRSVADFRRPLIIGQATTSTTTEDRYSCQCLAANLPLPGRKVRPGLLELNEDLLQIPLRWVIRVDDLPKSPYVQPVDSFGLAFATARAVQPSLDDQWRPQFEGSIVEHPYANLWGSEIPEARDVKDFLCQYGSVDVQDRWALDCIQHGQPMEISNKVIVIGEQSANDLKSLMGESLYGYDIHARYVAALLGGALLRPWTLWIQVLAAFALIGIVQVLIMIYGIDKRLPSPTQWGRRTPEQERNGLPVMLAVFLVSIGAIAFCVGSVLRGFLPPLPLIASLAILFVTSCQLWLGAKWVQVKEQMRDAKHTHG